MTLANSTWDAPRIHGELLKLGIDLGQSTISNYMVKPTKPPSQTWRTFLTNHAQDIASIDFFTVPTVMFRTLHVFVVLSLDRRRIVHFNVTYYPSAEWTARQLYLAFPFDSAPKYLVRDRDGIYGDEVVQAIKNMGVVDKVISTQSPWQNGHCERVVGSLKRECLNHVIVFDRRHANSVLKQYLEYYHGSRSHLGLEKASPDGRTVEPPEPGPVCRTPMVGGLHSRYYRDAA